MTGNEFQGSKVRLRAVEPEDWEASYLSSFDTDLDRLANLTFLPSSRGAFKTRAEEASKAPDNDKVRLIVETVEGTAVGSVSASPAWERRDRVFHFGLGIGREHWRKGYGTEALALLFRFYFFELGYQKAESGVYAFNEASLRFHEAFGFVVEGRRRRSRFTNGQYHDVVLIGMTVEEFAARHHPPG